MNIHLGSDHGGFVLKEEVKHMLTNMFFTVKDHGASHLDPEDDYPLYAHAVAKAIQEAPEDLGILFCRSGGGVAITANKVRGIRAVVVSSKEEAQHARAHNNAQIICIPGDIITDHNIAFQIIMEFINTPFEEGRHLRRLEMIAEYEAQEFK